MMRSSMLSLLVTLMITSTYTNGQGLPPQAFLDFARLGALLTYNIDISKCDVKLPDTLPAYSFGDVMTDVYIEYADELTWRLYATDERPVNTSRFQTENGGWRITEMEFTPSSREDGTAAITLTDIEQGAGQKVLATGNLSCTVSTGGFSVNAQHMGGRDLETEPEVMAALRRGEPLTFVTDLSQCTKQGGEPSLRPGYAPLAQAASEYWTGSVSGYRVPANIQQNAVEFTSLMMSPTQRLVFNVRVQGDKQVQVKSYALSRPTHEPTPVVIHECTLGAAGSFHVYHV